jgi:predicted methyltransferase
MKFGIIKSLSTVAGAGLLASSLLFGANALADRYDDAVQHTGRSAGDLKRDALDHPADMLRLIGIKRGMTVADIMGADGYYSELASYVVGPTGHVLLINNRPFDGWSEAERKPRLADGRLANVEHRTVDPGQMNLGADSVDAILLIKVYHDLYWVDADKKLWPDIDAPIVLDQIVRALKPGGVLLLVDHSARAGAGSADASALHRIEEPFARKDFESRGLHVIGRSDLLRQPNDKRDQVSYKPPLLGKTDRFVLVFKKS